MVAWEVVNGGARMEEGCDNHYHALDSSSENVLLKEEDPCLLEQ